MHILTAQVTNVAIGHLTIEGLMTEDERFWVGIPQMAEANLVPPNRSLKQLQALYGKAFQSHQKLKTALNPKAINAIALEDFTKVLIAIADTGNEAARSLRDELVGLSLHQLFCDAFGRKFEEEERQEFLKWRQVAREDFHSKLTNSMKRNLNLQPEEWAKHIKQFQDCLGIGSGTRNQLPSNKLTELAIAQGIAAELLDAGLSWEKILERVSALPKRK